MHGGEDAIIFIAGAVIIVLINVTLPRKIAQKLEEIGQITVSAMIKLLLPTVAAFGILFGIFSGNAGFGLLWGILIGIYVGVMSVRYMADPDNKTRKRLVALAVGIMLFAAVKVLFIN